MARKESKKPSFGSNQGKKRVETANDEVKVIDKPQKETIPTDLDDGTPLIEVNNISKNYKKKVVLEDINLKINKGDIFGIIGLSGSGKTTLFHIMNGILKATAGDVLVKRSLLFRPKKKVHPLKYVSVFKHNKPLHKEFGYANQVPSFYEHLTVRENIQIFGALFNIKKYELKKRIPKILKLTSLEEEQHTIAVELSGGMQRRLDIACSLISNPKVLFMDEPTSELDPILRKQMWKLIKEINAQGTTIIISSHILEEIEIVCNKIGIIHNRKMLGYGTLDELKKLFSRNQEVVIQLIPGNYSDLIKRLNKSKLKIEKIEERNGKLVLYLSERCTSLHNIIEIIEKSKERVVDLEVRDATLNEIFEILTKKKEEKNA